MPERCPDEISYVPPPAVHDDLTKMAPLSLVSCGFCTTLVASKHHRVVACDCPLPPCRRPPAPGRSGEAGEVASGFDTFEAGAFEQARNDFGLIEAVFQQQPSAGAQTWRCCGDDGRDRFQAIGSRSERVPRLVVQRRQGRIASTNVRGVREGEVEKASVELLPPRRLDKLDGGRQALGVAPRHGQCGTACVDRCPFRDRRPPHLASPSRATRPPKRQAIRFRVAESAHRA